jgi:site-specific DNA recombinase
LQERIGLVEGRARKVREQIHAVRHQMLDADEAAETLAIFDPVWETLTPHEQARVVQLLVEQVDYDGVKGTVAVTFHAADIKTLAEELARQHSQGRSA